MTADLGLVAHAAERHAAELAAQGARHRLTERRLAHARRAHQGQDGARAALGGGSEAAVDAQLAHREVLDDAVLHVVQTVVVGVEDGAGFGDLETVVRADAPGQLDDGVQPGADPPVLRALLACPLQAPKLALDGGLDGLRGVDIGQPSAVALVGLVAVALTQLLADGGQLLAQDVLPLAAVQVLGHVLADALLDRQLGQGLLGPGQDLAQAGLDVDLGDDTATVGLRSPNHEVARALCTAVGPLATTSANLHGEATPPTARVGGRCSVPSSSPPGTTNETRCSVIRPGPAWRAPPAWPAARRPSVAPRPACAS